VAPVELFVVAHPDDWQLFAGDVVVEALREGARVVAVVTSAGGDDRPAAFWRARERGALASAQAALALAGVGEGAGEGAPPATCQARVVRGSGLVVASPTVCVQGVQGAQGGQGAQRGGRFVTVFLRLPDGRGDGSGFARTGHQSLTALEQGRLLRLDAVDGAGGYRSVGEVANAVVAVLRGEGVPAPALQGVVGGGMSRARVRVHTHDPERRFNPLDHADHRVTGRVALAVAQQLGAPAVVYAGYTNIRRADNLSAQRGAWKAWLFVAYDRVMLAANGRWSAYAENAWAHAAYLGRTYGRPWGRVVPTGGGAPVR
jgi:LmbE family N-acetylglucosaminyl deacetylase